MAKMLDLEAQWKESTQETELKILKSIHREMFETTSCTDFFDLELTNKEKNTVLHCLTQTIGTVPEEKETCLKMFDDFISTGSQWWKWKRNINVSHSDGKYLAVKNLTLNIHKSGLSVLELAFKVGAVEVIQRLMLMEDVNCLITKDKRRYDISYMTPKTSGLAIFRCSAGDAGVSCLELLQNNLTVRAAEILEIEPLKQLEQIYTSITTRIYWIMALIHILYMAIFSYSSCKLLLQRKINATGDINATSSSSTSTKTMFYTVVPIEPILLTVYMAYNLFKVASCKSGFYVKFWYHHFCRHFLLGLTRLILTFSYIIIVCVSVYLYHVDSPSQYYMISLSLLFGWLVTFFFTRGIRPIHFFLKVIYQVILADVLKVLFVYLFFFLAFSLAIHAQFLSSSKILAVYKTPFHTMFLMFNVMLGMGDQLLDPEIESSLEESGLAPLYSKILYTIYVIFVPIILLNLLIAMMNTSYTRILDTHALIWRIDSILLGVDVERNVPYLAKLCGKGTVYQGKMFSDCAAVSDAAENVVWYVEIDAQSEQSESGDEVDGTEMQMMDDSPSDEISRLTEKLHLMNIKLNRLETLLESINDKITDKNSTTL